MVKRRKALEDGRGSSVLEAASISVSGRSRIDGTRRKRLIRAQVMRMLSLREEESSAAGMRKDDSVAAGSAGAGASGTDGVETSKEFLSSGRTGRRNALPDILGQHAGTGTADLPARLEALTTDADPSNAEDERNRPGTSKDRVG